MKKMMLKMSRRERLYLFAGGAVLLVGVVVYPATKAAAAYRLEQTELLEDEVALLQDFNEMLNNAAAIQQQNQQLRDALRTADSLLFPPIENPIMTQTMMIKLLNELGPDLNLDISAGRSSVEDGANQMNLSIRGRGRYPEILKFLHRVESYRPLILVNEMLLTAPKSKRLISKKPVSKPKKGIKKTKDPSMVFRMSIQINCQNTEDGA